MHNLSVTREALYDIFRKHYGDNFRKKAQKYDFYNDPSQKKQYLDTLTAVEGSYTKAATLLDMTSSFFQGELARYASPEEIKAAMQSGKERRQKREAQEAKQFFEHYKQTLSIDQTAGAFNASPSRIDNLIKRYFGEEFAEIQIYRRRTFLKPLKEYTYDLPTGDGAALTEWMLNNRAYLQDEARTDIEEKRKIYTEHGLDSQTLYDPSVRISHTDNQGDINDGTFLRSIGNTENAPQYQHPEENIFSTTQTEMRIQELETTIIPQIQQLNATAQSIVHFLVFEHVSSLAAFQKEPAKFYKNCDAETLHESLRTPIYTIAQDLSAIIESYITDIVAESAHENDGLSVEEASQAALFAISCVALDTRGDLSEAAARSGIQDLDEYMQLEATQNCIALAARLYYHNTITAFYNQAFTYKQDISPMPKKNPPTTPPESNMQHNEGTKTMTYTNNYNVNLSLMIDEDLYDNAQSVASDCASVSVWFSQKIREMQDSKMFSKTVFGKDLVAYRKNLRKTGELTKTTLRVSPDVLSVVHNIRDSHQIGAAHVAAFVIKTALEQQQVMPEDEELAADTPEETRQQPAKTFIESYFLEADKEALKRKAEGKQKPIKTLLSTAYAALAQQYRALDDPSALIEQIEVATVRYKQQIKREHGTPAKTRQGFLCTPEVKEDLRELSRTSGMAQMEIGTYCMLSCIGKVQGHSFPMSDSNTSTAISDEDPMIKSLREYTEGVESTAPSLQQVANKHLFANATQATEQVLRDYVTAAQNNTLRDVHILAVGLKHFSCRI